MFLLQRVAISNNNPSLRGKQGLLKSLICKSAKFNFLFEVPKTTTVVFYPFKIVRLELKGLFEVDFCIEVLHPLKITSCF
jgi:hypothetical protein